MQHSTEPRRACITGCGALSPIGNSVAEFWAALVAGRTGLQPIRSFDTSGMTVEVKGTRTSPLAIAATKVEKK